MLIIQLPKPYVNTYYRYHLSTTAGTILSAKSGTILRTITGTILPAISGTISVLSSIISANIFLSISGQQRALLVVQIYKAPKQFASSCRTIPIWIYSLSPARVAHQKERTRSMLLSIFRVRIVNGLAVRSGLSTRHSSILLIYLIMYCSILRVVMSSQVLNLSQFMLNIAVQRKVLNSILKT